MLVEQRINEMLERHGRYNPIESWLWDGSPLSEWQPYDNHDYKVHRIQSYVDGMINQAAEAECLLSPSQYIRELKLWLKTNSFHY